MNNLNSILIEGTVDGEVIFKDISSKHKEVFFAIESIRKFKYEDEVVENKIFVRVKATGRLAEVCNSYLKEGSGVRIVGRLDQNSEGCMFVLAEHVEFKPTIEKKEAETEKAVEPAEGK